MMYDKTMRWVVLPVAMLIVGVVGLPARADVRLPGLFSSHMVVQQGVPLPVWGWADAGENVTVKIGDQEQTVTAGANGKWRVTLDALKPGGPQTLTVSGSNSITVEDVLVGEVWIGSGQSNMAMRVNRSADAAEEMAAAELPQIRMFTVRSNAAKQPAEDCEGSWSVCSPNTVGEFSATLFYFGRELHRELDVPVGLINSSVGGTPIERWAGAEGFPNDLYNGKIAPLAPYGIRGVVWYQGERNAKSGSTDYGDNLVSMVKHWRSVWGQGEFPFYWVQLPNFHAAQELPSETTGWVHVRDGMRRALALPHTGMAVTLDVGEAKNIHPKNKQAVGKRLALWALAQAYDKSIVGSGPLYRGMSKRDGGIVLEFDHVGGGLAAVGGGQLKGFAIAGKDKQFVWADAKIEKDTVVVSSEKVAEPVAVRYAWADNPEFSLTNKGQLLASPFRTDNWDDVP